MAEDKIKTSATQNLPTRDETQGSLDLLSLALAQTSRDPNLMAQVQLNIDRRMQAAREAEIEAMKQVGASQRTTMEQQGLTSRAQLASRTQLTSTAMAQEGQDRRAAMEDATKRAIAGLESRDKALDRQIQREQLEAEKTGKQLERIQPIMRDAQSDLVRLLTSGAGKDDPITKMVQAQAAGLVGKEKLSDEEQRTVAMASALGSGGPMDYDSALQLVTSAMGARMKALPPEDQALAAQGLQAWAENFRLLNKASYTPQDAVNALVAMTPLLVNNSALSTVERFTLQNRLKAAWEAIEDDPTARTAAVQAVRDKLLAMGEADIDNPEELSYALGQWNMILADGLQFEDAAALQKVLNDLNLMVPLHEGLPGLVNRAEERRLRAGKGIAPQERTTPLGKGFTGGP